MKTLHIFKSEQDNSIHVCDETQLDSFNKKHNAEIAISPKLRIKPWQPLGKFSFQAEQAADEFKAFLETVAGVEFARRYIFLNPLSELKKLIAAVPKSCKFYVMGGLALDGHNGQMTRRHDDLDLICWRKDVDVLKKALKGLGYGVRERYSKEDPHVLRLLETDEEYPSIEVKIIDEAPQSSFQFHMNAPGRSVFPKKLLGPKHVTLEGVKFPAISLALIAELNQLSRNNLKHIENSDPKLFKALGYKITNVTKDSRLIRALMKREA